VITIGEPREWIATHVPAAAHSVSTSLETAGQTFAEATDELVRHFYVRMYVRMPKSWFRRRTSVEARLICELRTRGGLRQELVFKRAAAEALAAQQAQ
jgi:hypothetical protein